MTDTRPPPAWAILADALALRRPVGARYHGNPRVLCPHALGWKNGRAKVLTYQSSPGPGTGAPDQPWRSMFVDEIEDPVILTDQPWATAPNYSTKTNGIDQIEIAIDPLN